MKANKQQPASQQPEQGTGEQEWKDEYMPCIGTINHDFKELWIKNQSLQQTISSLEQDNERLREESKHDLDVITHYEDLVKEYEKDLNEQNEEKSELTMERDGLKDENLECRKSLADLESQLREAKEEIERQKSVLNLCHGIASNPSLDNPAQMAEALRGIIEETETNNVTPIHS